MAATPYRSLAPICERKVRPAPIETADGATNPSPVFSTQWAAVSTHCGSMRVAPQYWPARVSAWAAWMRANWNG